MEGAEAGTGAAGATVPAGGTVAAVVVVALATTGVAGVTAAPPLASGTLGETGGGAAAFVEAVPASADTAPDALVEGAAVAPGAVPASAAGAPVVEGLLASVLLLPAVPAGASEPPPPQPAASASTSAAMGIQLFISFPPFRSSFLMADRSAGRPVSSAVFLASLLRPEALLRANASIGYTL